MRKYRWVVIAGVCVVALIVVGAVFVPRALRSPPSSAEDEYVTVMPGHWWQISLDEQKIEVLRSMWGTDIYRKQLIDALWPGVLEELPAEASALWETQRVRWPSEAFDNWRELQSWAFSAVPAVDKGAMMFDVYLGCRGWETDSTFMASRDRGIAEDNRYRISMYTDEVLGYIDGPVEAGRYDRG